MAYQLQKLKLKNFRLYKEAEFDFKKLNLLIGGNSSGKSTVSKALLLLENSLNRHQWSKLAFGEGVDGLGGFESVRNRDCDKDCSIGFEILLKNIDIEKEPDPEQAIKAIQLKLSYEKNQREAAFADGKVGVLNEFFLAVSRNDENFDILLQGQKNVSPEKSELYVNYKFILNEILSLPDFKIALFLYKIWDQLSLEARNNIIERQQIELEDKYLSLIPKISAEIIAEDGRIEDYTKRAGGNLIELAENIEKLREKAKQLDQELEELIGRIQEKEQKALAELEEVNEFELEKTEINQLIRVIETEIENLPIEDEATFLKLRKRLDELKEEKDDLDKKKEQEENSIQHEAIRELTVEDRAECDRREIEYKAVEKELFLEKSRMTEAIHNFIKVEKIRTTESSLRSDIHNFVITKIKKHLKENVKQLGVPDLEESIGDRLETKTYWTEQIDKIISGEIYLSELLFEKYEGPVRNLSKASLDELKTEEVFNSELLLNDILLSEDLAVDENAKTDLYLNLETKGIQVINSFYQEFNLSYISSRRGYQQYIYRADESENYHINQALAQLLQIQNKLSSGRNRETKDKNKSSSGRNNKENEKNEFIQKWAKNFGLTRDEEQFFVAPIQEKNVRALIGNPAKPEEALNLADRGFGHTQLVPLIIQTAIYAFSEKKGMLIIEEPGIHLHPDLQAKLVDFMVDAIKHGVQFLVETHSEYFIHKLRVMVIDDSETKALLNHKDVIIHSIDQGKTDSIRVFKDGGLEKELPESFYNQSTYLLKELEKKKELSAWIRAMNKIGGIDKPTLFVEGPTDQQVLKAVFKKLGYDDECINVIDSKGSSKVLNQLLQWEYSTRKSKAVGLIDYEEETIKQKKYMRKKSQSVIIIR
ncbi:AAA family ATPase [Saprospira sp. CCB-QB6]|uniref:AAA family ATPase n=1 Tax=Saprospira sp. CCB-QB6 TaxID=3023936 RepID=UPI00234AF5ED|nr:AAA family ATPase [Saprospira sp. CCB-QB6]WCL81674.1 AAA family ATPase [Saprospira sp. CCB-QB6]